MKEAMLPCELLPHLLLGSITEAWPRVLLAIHSSSLRVRNRNELTVAIANATSRLLVSAFQTVCRGTRSEAIE
eukprot:737842-Amphidinium_carterae.1